MNIYTRKLDELGRVVLPMELRAKMALNVTDTVEISYENDTIVIRAGEPRCRICFSKTDVNKELCVCADCIEKIKNA